MGDNQSYRQFLDPDTETHRATFDPDTESVSDAVVRVVTSATNTEAETLEPIENVVDPIIFDALVRRERREIQISFVYHDQHVTVDSSGQIFVQPRQAERGPTPRFQFEDSDSASDAVVSAIAATKGIDEMDVAPLYDYIDPEALDKLFEDADADDIVVSFSFDSLCVHVKGEDFVAVSR